MGCCCSVKRIAMDETFPVKDTASEARAVLKLQENWLRIIPDRTNDSFDASGAADHWVLGTGSKQIHFTDFTEGEVGNTGQLTLAYSIAVGPAKSPLTTLDVRYEFTPTKDATPEGSTSTIRRVVSNQRAHGIASVVSCAVFSQTKGMLAQENANMKQMIDEGTGKPP
eukprot:m.83385 g.83385  ORF g.83385 m.83385 type:complete len:168 (-) comp19631_c0_seq3:201-704(-)